MDKILPTPSPVSQPYFDGCKQGELLLQHCSACDRSQFYPRVMCSHCGGDSLTWRRAGGEGVVASFTVVRRPVSKAYDAPYVIALIDLPEGVRMMAQLAGVDVDTVSVGLSVKAQFEAWSDEVTLPVFYPA
ncbi:MAG: hypothetical protein RLZZ602_936 [Pseudomonadota bacterium]|jgi:uncharacterized OB-fold protein